MAAVTVRKPFSGQISVAFKSQKKRIPRSRFLVGAGGTQLILARDRRPRGKRGAWEISLMRTLIASGMLGLLVLPAAAAEQKVPDPKETRVSLTDGDATPNALMDSVGPASAESGVSLGPDKAGRSQSESESRSDSAPAKPVVYRPITEVCNAVKQSAKSNNLPVPFFIRLLHQESGFRPDVVSHAGAQGVAQFMPETASLMGLENPFDPLQAIPASARLLRNLLAQFGNIGLAAAAYNAGPRRIQDWLNGKNKKTRLPDETQGYVRAITGKPVENWKTVSKLVPDNRPITRAPCKPDNGEVMQVAEAPPPAPKDKLRKLAAGAKGSLKRAADLKSRMASRKKPAIAILKKDNARVLAEGVRAKPRANAVLANRAGKGTPVKMAHAN
jgi:hypothetical protein